MLQSRVCQILGIEYPILQAGMPWLANAELAAAVSNEGGLGLVTPTAGLGAQGDVVSNLRKQIHRTHSLTDRPFGVHIFLGVPNVQNLLEAALTEGVKVVVTSGGSPALHTGYLKDNEVKVIHMVASVRHAKGAEAQGVDMVIAEGFEGAGLRGYDGIPTFVLLPQVVDAVEIPVVASGGIADARGLVAAFALGAEGVHIGTRFAATHECVAHPAYKEAIVKAIDTGTMVVGGRRMHARLLKGEAASRLQEMAGGNALEDERWEALLWEQARAALLEGRLDEGIASCGAGAGIITEVLSVAQVMKMLVEGYNEVLSRLK
ncbi:MAG: 2-nitropropane dioxygenase [Dehalococcoidia bacterium]|nr:2-nitropropane dioxygenase [Dehalococcoidia bacterium]